MTAAAAIPDRDDAPVLVENIRLVIWDLDETFWRGTLSEGGVDLIDAHVQLVRMLNARGIMNSICSKNDMQPVQRILTEHDLWDQFIFPDVSWAPKGPRLRRLIERTRLRPASVLFIDDNATNRAEAAQYTPGLNVADERFIGRLLHHPRLIGNPDPGMLRHAQYKRLELRDQALEGEGATTIEFLRDSQVEVVFCYDVRPHLLRVIELINRTNQLNFIKSRLPEDTEAARAALEPYLDHYIYQCALIQVSDAYGDHGFCGFYIYETQPHRLLQFCFSCRIIGLGVERWVYEKLGSPEIAIAGAVAADLVAPTPVDWINVSTPRAGARPRLAHAVTARGGCELAALTHYFLSVSNDVAIESNIVRGALQVRLDHTVILDQARRGLTGAQLDVAQRLQFRASDFHSRLLQGAANLDAADLHAVILSFSSDVGAILARHRRTGFIAPLFLPRARWTGEDDAWLPDIDAGTLAASQVALDYVRAEFDLLGPIDRGRFMTNVTTLLNNIPSATPVFILGLYEGRVEADGLSVRAPVRSVLVNRWTRAAANGRRNVHLLRMEDYAGPGEAMENAFHFRRSVYHRVFEAIEAALRQGEFAGLATKPPLRTRARSALLGLRSGAVSPLKALIRQAVI